MQQYYKRWEIAHLPTPLERTQRLTTALAGPEIFVKRDDATGLAGGGNKARKLEFLVADALAQGANCLVTVGGPQSNHARMTAAIAARLGLKCRLYLKGERPRGLRGNLLLDKLLGAQLIFCGGKEYPEIYAQIDDDAEELARRGIKIYKVPLGGSTPVGALGYVRAITEELVPQCKAAGIKPEAIALAAGSGGTMAGVMLGLALAGWQDVAVHGYCVSGTAPALQAEVAAIYNGAGQILGTDARIAPEQVVMDDSQVGAGYGIATPGCLEALKLFAHTEGLLLDSVYTAKAAAGMIADIRRGTWQKGPVVFIHTGGWPALFAKDDVENWLIEEDKI
ncbi:MAG: D-cysteine desulfhydrase family protein [Bacillota bacterium]|jgi:D-cysteine desulfhydrase family pyridoxal phosphate-dependent enzyme